METKGKRIGRAVTPPESSVPTGVPIRIQPSEAAEPISHVAPRPSSEVVMRRVSSAVPAIRTRPRAISDFGSEAFDAIEESRAAVTRGLDALSEELAGLARCGIDTAARTAIEILAIKTFSDAIAVNVSFARASFDNWVGSSAKFSEQGVKIAIESSRPFVAYLGKSWNFSAHPDS